MVGIAIPWRCDFCGKSGLVVSLAGVLYCPWCRGTYGEKIYDKMDKEKLKELQKLLAEKGATLKDSETTER